MTNSAASAENRNQYLAVFLTFLGLLAVGLADCFGWRDLASQGGTVIGFGGGILTGKYLMTNHPQASDLPPGSLISTTDSVQTPPVTITPPGTQEKPT